MSHSQAAQILDYLLAGNSITPLEALDKFGCFRLGARIWDLRKAGHPIDDVLVHENGKKFSRYFFQQKGRVGETHLGLLSLNAHAHKQTGEQSRKVSLGFQAGERNTPTADAGWW